MKHPKFAIVNDWYGPEIVGGVEIAISEMTEAFLRSKIDFKIFTPRQKGHIGEHSINGTKINYILLPFFRLKYTTSQVILVLEKFRVYVDPLSPLILITQIKKYGPDFILFNEIERFGPWLLILIRFFFRKNQLIRIQHDLSDTCLKRSRNYKSKNCNPICKFCKTKNFLYSRLSHQMATNICVSNFIEQDLCASRYNVKQSQVGYPISIFSETVSSQTTLNFKRSRSKYALGYVGRITKLKGVETILMAAALCEPNWEVHLIGPCTPKYNIKLQKIADNLKLKLFIYAASSEPYRLLKPKVDCLVIASESFESFGKVSIEAVTSGIPIISTNTGGLSEALSFFDPKPQIFESGSPSSLALCLESFKTKSNLRVHIPSEFTLTSKIYDITGSR